MKVLVTGGVGFIASHIIERLLKNKAEILILDNLATGRENNIPDSPLVTFLNGDIADADFVNGAFQSFTPEYVIYAAASYKDPDDWATDTSTNIIGGANIVKASLKHNIKRLVYFQTALCYGLSPDEQPITLNHALYPENSSYAITKTAAEQYIRMSGLDYISFRLANIIGPRNMSGPVAAFYNRLAAGKKCFVMDTRRDFVFVEDLVNVVEKAVSGMGHSGIYHISSGSDYSIKEVFEATVAAMNIQLEEEIDVREPSADDAGSILLEPSKTNADFNWKVTTPLETAVGEAVQWYQNNEVSETYTHLKKTEE